jgi:hypothetical protein
MVRLKAVELIEELSAADDLQREPGQGSAQSFVINIVSRSEPLPVTIEGRRAGPFLANREERSPEPSAALEPLEEPNPPAPEPIFKWKP